MSNPGDFWTSGDQPELLALLHTPTRGEGTSREPQKNVAVSQSGELGGIYT